MVAETNLGASFETPRQLENLDGSSSERPNLDLEKPKEVAEPKMETATQSAPAPVINTVKLVTPYEERRRNIEMTLAKNLEEIYLSMPPDKRAEFKMVGEETSEKINQLLEKTKVNLGKIVTLIRKWLSLLPGVNKLFLEQEAKIRADEIMKFKREE